MNITKCDICKKTIDHGNRSLRIMPEGFCGGHIELCPNCAKPVMKFLRSKKLIKKETNKKYGGK